MKTILRLALVALAAKVAYELVQRGRTRRPLPAGGPYEPAPLPARSQEPAAADGADLTAVNGIGPVYAARLASTGIRSLEDLAAADAADVAIQIEVSATTVEDWQAQARRLQA